MNAGMVVVGAGLAGAKAVETLRDRGYSGAVTLIGDEPHLPYERPPLSKDYLQGKVERSAVFVHPDDWYTTNDVAVRLGDPVTAIDRHGRGVRLTSGDTVGYDRLLLTTGSTPNRLRVPGADLRGVHYLRRIEDSEAIRAAFDDAQRVAIIGGGWIGLETASAARAAGRDVTILEQAPLPLIGVIGAELAAMFADLHRDHGVDVRTDVQVQQIVGRGTKASGVALADGAVIEADVVLVGVGISPNVQLAQEAGLAVENGIVVDEHLRTTDEHVFAAGDVANALHPFLGRHIRVEHWANALHQPEVAALSMLGDDVTFDRIPFFYSDQYDLGLEYTGYVERDDYDEIVIRGNRDKREFIAFWLKDQRVLAGMNVNVWDVAESINHLVRSRQPIDRVALADPDVPLASMTD